jgi:hypothetical protein
MLRAMLDKFSSSLRFFFESLPTDKAWEDRLSKLTLFLRVGLVGVKNYNFPFSTLAGLSKTPFNLVILLELFFF